MKIFLMMSLLTFSSVAVGGQAWDVSKTTTSHADAPGDACEQAEAIATAYCKRACSDRQATFEMDPKAKTCTCDSPRDSTCVITVKGTCITN